MVRGRKYSPQEIEQLLDDLPGVRAGCAAALGYSDGSDTERVVILVERARSSAVLRDDDELVAGVRSRIAEGAGLVVDDVQILEPGTLPRTSR